MRYTTKSEIQTFNLGKKLAKQLKGGEVLALIGPLGAGKTVFIKGLAAGLGIKKIITSPTFVLMKIYKLPTAKLTNLPTYLSRAKLRDKLTNLIHLDCYRIKNPQEIVDIGATEYFGRKDTVVVIEWADKIKSILPSRQKIEIVISLSQKPNQRLIKVKK